MEDSGALANHGYLPDPNMRVSYTTDSNSGGFALDFNNPADTRPRPGAISMPHTPSLEPAHGMVEASLKIVRYHAAVVIEKSTFQWLNREPGDLPPLFIIDGNERIVGRTVYQLAITGEGRVRGTIGNDSLNQPGPWTAVESTNLIALNTWNRIAVK